MSATNKSQPVRTQLQAVNEGVSTELSNEALRSLAGFFDVLIQMDFNQRQRNERKGKENDKDKGTN